MSNKKINRLLLIFDADSGKWGAFVDSAKKLLMLKGCALCDITHGVLGEKAEWKSCKEEFGIDIDYVHRDELDDELKKQVAMELPCIVAQTIGGEFLQLITREVLERCEGSASSLRGKLRYYSSMYGLELSS